MPTRLTVDIDSDLKRRVKIAAARQDQSIKEWVVNALEQALEHTIEDNQWLKQDLSELSSLEPYEWGDDTVKKDEHPVIFDEHRGFVVVGGKPKDV